MPSADARFARSQGCTWELLHQSESPAHLSRRLDLHRVRSCPRSSSSAPWPNCPPRVPRLHHHRRCESRTNRANDGAEEVTSKRAQALAGGEDDKQGRDTTSNGRGSEKPPLHRMAATPVDRAPSAPRRRFTASDVEPRMETRETANGSLCGTKTKHGCLTKAFMLTTNPGAK